MPQSLRELRYYQRSRASPDTVDLYNKIMASKGVTGATKEELEELRREFQQKPAGDIYDFEERRCLAKIPKQPDDYDGPQRYCTSTNVNYLSNIDAWLCKYHGGSLNGRDNLDPDGGNENLDKLANMKHGLYAAREHVRQDFDDKDLALYDWIVEEFANAYEIGVDDDPSAAYDLHRLAVEIVRGERGRGFLVQEGEVRDQEVYDADGNVVIDEQGEVVTEKSEHYLAQMMHRQDKKITELERTLGIDRKSRMKADQTDDAVDAIKSFAEVGADMLARDEKDYDPDKWEDDDDE